MEQEMLDLLDEMAKGRDRYLSLLVYEAFLSRMFSNDDCVESRRGGRFSRSINRRSFSLNPGVWLAGIRLNAMLRF